MAAPRKSRAKPSPHPLKKSLRDWDWPLVLNEIADRWLSIGGAITMAELCDKPYVDDKGKEWHMPDPRKVYRAMAEKPELAAQVAELKKLRSMALGDELFRTVRDVNTVFEGDRGRIPNAVNVQLARLQADTYKWYLARLNPADFGDKSQVDIKAEVKDTTDWDDIFSEGAPKPKGDGT